VNRERAEKVSKKFKNKKTLFLNNKISIKAIKVTDIKQHNYHESISARRAAYCTTMTNLPTVQIVNSHYYQ